MKFFSLLSLAALLLLPSCLYKMPTDDCICTLPTMGNPQVTKEKPRSLLPGQGS